MIVGASQLRSYTRPLNCFVCTIRSVTCPSLISLRHNSSPNLTYKFNKSNLTACAVAKEVKDDVSINSEIHSCAWGLASICGPSQKLQQDIVVAIPEFLKATTSPHLTHLATAPFFGVYAGNGAGPEVAEYCRDRLHSALAEDLEVHVAYTREFFQRIGRKLDEQITEDEWRESLTSSFCKVNAEVKTKGVAGPHLSPQPVGSTAVVAIVCPSHIVVANCGNSRAVLKRGRESIPLSVDYKADELGDDEYARIEAAGGKIRKWYPGTSGAFASFRFYASLYRKYFPRAIGEGHWNNGKTKHVVPDPEVTLFPRTQGDRCLVLASDGLWDVMTNEEACDIADEMIRESSSSPRAAAEYLSSRAVEKGSRDNIGVLVIDLESLPRA